MQFWEWFSRLIAGDGQAQVSLREHLSLLISEEAEDLL